MLTGKLTLYIAEALLFEREASCQGRRKSETVVSSTIFRCNLFRSRGVVLDAECDLHSAFL